MMNKFNKIILLVILYSTSFAQLKEFIITPLPLPSGFSIIMSSPTKDAAVIIYSSIPGLRFESDNNKIIDIKEEDGNYTLFIKPQKTIIKVKKKEFIEQSLPLLSLSAKEVKYFMVEEKDNTLSEIQINISSNPTDPKIFIDGKFLGTKPQIKVTPGVHVLRLEKDGYKTLEKSIEVTETNRYFWESMDLIENIAVTISSEPDKASLFIDNTSKGETPQRVFLFPGKYKLKLTKAGFRDFEKVIEISDTGKTYYSFPLMGIGIENIAVTISSEPDKASLFIDNTSKGETPQRVFLFPGKYKLKLTKAGFRDFEKVIEISDTGKSYYSFPLMGIGIENIAVTISSEPDKASLFIDNTSKGETPQRVFLFPGKYKLKLTKAGFRDFEKVIEISDTGKSYYSFPLIGIGGELELNITPSDCDIYINRVKQIQQKQYNLSPGKYNIQLSKEGYYDKDTIIDIEPGKKISKAFNLVAKKVNAPVAQVVLINENKAKIEDITLKKNVEEGNKKKENKPIEIKPVEIKPIVNTTFSKKLSLDTITYEGKTYHQVNIGTQGWLKENLDVGTMIKKSESQTNNSVIEKYCYNDKIENCTKYGGLYQWEEAMQYVTTLGTKGICPTGWHIPTIAELQILAATVNNDGNALKGIDQGSESGAGTNTSGFSALLAGYRNYLTDFTNLGNQAYFWSSTEKDESYSQSMYLSSDNNNIKFTIYKKKVGLSVRCLKD
jgi:uncharacterized protein (TIGR02145 family)